MDPPFDAADPLIVPHLNAAALAKREKASYDNSPGSLCEPEGWFPFISYGYGFPLLRSAGKITIVPVEPDTKGIRRVYFAAQHPQANPLETATRLPMGRATR